MSEKFCNYLDDDGSCSAHYGKLVRHKLGLTELKECPYTIKDVNTNEKGEYVIRDAECVDFYIIMNKPGNKEMLDKLLKKVTHEEFNRIYNDASKILESEIKNVKASEDYEWMKRLLRGEEK